MQRRALAFSLIEVLDVIGIIAILLGILIPAITASQVRAAAAKCVSNAGQIAMAMNEYLRDHRNYFPVTDDPSEWDVVGGQNKRLSSYTDSQWDVAACPLDNGYKDTGPIPMTEDSLYSEADDRSSYRYISENGSPGTPATFDFYAGMVEVENHRVTEFSHLPKKVVISDAPLGDESEVPASDSKNQWHNTSDPLLGSAGFADGSAKELRRKLSSYTTDFDAVRDEEYY